MKHPSSMPRRRTVVRELLYSLCVGASITLPALTPIAAAEDRVEIAWTVPVAGLPKVKNDISATIDVTGDPSSVDASKGLPLLYVVAGLVLLPELAKALLDVYRDAQYGATIIEVKSGKVAIRHDPTVSGDIVITKGKDGVAVVHDGRKGFDVKKWAELVSSVAKKP